MAVRMELSRLLIRELTDMQIIELREVLPDTPPNANPDAPADAPSTDDPREARTFPIVIGLPEAQAIDRRLKGLPISRPQTHDLMASIIETLGGQLQSITINDLSGGTFFATLSIRQGDETLSIDSRPSDAIALGIATSVPIFVAEHVLDAAASEEP